ncbi:MAG: hypothetical protein ACFE9I_16415 [Candidatus Hermodarchaeota archaeon]
MLNNNLILEITEEYLKLHGLDKSIFDGNDIDQIIGLRFKKPKKTK